MAGLYGGVIAEVQEGHRRNQEEVKRRRRRERSSCHMIGCVGHEEAEDCNTLYIQKSRGVLDDVILSRTEDANQVIGVVYRMVAVDAY